MRTPVWQRPSWTAQEAASWAAAATRALSRVSVRARGGEKRRDAPCAYRFQGNSSDYVSLADVTYEPNLSRLIAFHAVQWVPRQQDLAQDEFGDTL